MIRAHGRERVHIVVGEEIVPLIGDKDHVDPLQGGVSTFIAPSEETALEVNLFHHCFFKKPPELAHKPTIQVTIVLSASSVHHIEVPIKQKGQPSLV
jgi:hypothetical protein